MPEKNATDGMRVHWTSRVLVFLQFAALLGLIGTVRQANALPAVLLLISAGGGVGVSAVCSLRHQLRIHPEPAEGGRLVTEGIYTWIRHPMYTAVLLGGLGLWLLDPGGLRLCLYLGLITVLWMKIRREETILRQRFPDYSGYAERTKRIIPFVF